MLIVLDNANHPDQVRPLLPGSPGCLVLITSRASLTGLVVSEAATRITVDLMGPHEATDLVRRIVGRERADAEAEAVTKLTQVCARLPLALRIAAGQVTSRPHRAISDVLADTNNDQYWLDSLSGSADNTTAVRAVFNRSYLQLTAEQAQLFRYLGLHTGADISIHAAAALAGLPIRQARRLIEELADTHMIEPASRERYHFHDLLRAYASERAEQEDSSDKRNRARRRLLSWYIQISRDANGLIYPAYWRLLPDSEEPTGPVLAFADRSNALDWLDIEHGNLVGAAQDAVRHDLHDLAIYLVDALAKFLLHRAHWGDVHECANLGIAAARIIGNRAAEADCLMRRGEAYTDTAQWDAALEYLHRALAIARDLPNQQLEAGALCDIGVCFLDQKRHAEALSYLELALPLSFAAGDVRLSAVIEGNIGGAHVGLGNHALARDHAERSLALRRQAGDREGECATLHYLALAAKGMGSHLAAISLCERAIDVGREYSRQFATAEILDTLGSLVRQAGDVARAGACWSEALEIFDKFDDYRAANLRGRLEKLRPNALDQSKTTS